MLASYLLSAFFSAAWINDAQLVLFTGAGLLGIRNSPIRRTAPRLVAIACLIAGLVLTDLVAHEGGDAGRAAAALWAGTLLLVIVVFLVRQVLAQPDVTMQSIYGVISAYLIIGLMFAAFYSGMYFLRSRTFFVGHELGTISNFQYFSFTTLTTLGYGDFTAATSGGRAVAMIEAMTGQIFLATLVAKLVSSFRPASAASASESGCHSASNEPLT